jgi:hypothetical protein
MNYNISKTAQMIVDLRNGTYKAFSAEANPEKVNEALRAKFKEMLPVPNAMGHYNYRKMMKALPEVFEVMEEVLNITINDAWKASTFYNQFVDSRNLALGDKADFIIDTDTWVTVNKFSGNTWDTDREKVSGRKKITVDTAWFYAHVYDDFERFLIGAITAENLLVKMTDAFIKHIDTMVAVAFNDASTNLPAAFNVAATLATADMRELIQKVKTASRANVNIMGTEMAITRLNELAEVKYSSDMMNEVYSTGRLAKWMGNTVVEIPQAFTPGTYDWAVDNDSLLIVPAAGDNKFIKFVDEGETRSRDLTEQDTHDQTLDWQVQRKMGCAAIFGTTFGKYIIQ